MRLPFLRSRAPAASRSGAAPVPAEPVVITAARTRARQRLVGALVLLVIGVVGFPVLFETRPRPLPLDTPIVLQRAEAPAAEPKTPAPLPRPAPAAVPALPPADAGIEAAPAAMPAVEPPPPAPSTAPVQSAAAVASEAASAPRTQRFIVQVGAFTDPNMLREARQRAEKLGFKTYTQVIEGDGARRTRVRVGPYATRDEAETAAAGLKRSGLAANVLAL